MHPTQIYRKCTAKKSRPESLLEDQGSTKCIPVPVLSDKSFFVGQIEIQGFKKTLYFVRSVGQFDHFIL